MSGLRKSVIPGSWISNHQSRKFPGRVRYDGAVRP
jgi:hypothetical protein